MLNYEARLLKLRLMAAKLYLAGAQNFLAMWTN
jgi:hypothetical protein